MTSDGDSTVRFIVPTLPTDVYPLYVSNKKVGASQQAYLLVLVLSPATVLKGKHSRAY